MKKPAYALTVKQPWAHAIIHLGKNVENRSWRTSYTGPLLIHAAASAPLRLPLPVMSPVKYEDLVRGAIIGVVELVDCVRDAKSKWAEPGQWHWLLRNARPIGPVRCAGRLRLWHPTAAQTRASR
jgi:hypothetical protein